MLHVHAASIHLIPRRHSRLPHLFKDSSPLAFCGTRSNLRRNLLSRSFPFRPLTDRRIPAKALLGEGNRRRHRLWARDSPSCKHLGSHRRVLVKEKLAAASKVPAATTVRIAEVTEEEATAEFQISATELASIVEDQDYEKLSNLGGVEGVAAKLSSSLARGISNAEDQIRARQNIYGVNELTEPEPKNFWAFLLDAAQDSTLIILGACSVIALLVGVSVEGWPAGSHDGLGIAASIIVVVLVTASSNYRQSLQFRDLDAEKKKISIQVTRSGSRKKLPVSDLLPGDIVHLSIGDRVPADGLFVSGFSLLVNASSLTGESEPVAVNADDPFLSAGTKVQDGFGKMLVTSVGMRTQWGKLVAALGETEEGETPLQVKLNGVASVIGKIGLFFAALTFIVLAGNLVNDKVQDGSLMSWTGDDALEILNYFAIAVTIVVVAVPEGLPLAVTLSLAFAMKKMMNDRALVRHLAACETMGSATCICSDKTGTLTTNRMTVGKALVCGRIFEVGDEAEIKKAKTLIPSPAMKALLQTIFCNTSGEVVFDERGGYEILGSPTESSLLALGVSLGGDVDEKVKVVKVEPFNSSKKRMSVLVEVQEGRHVAYCKGASEIVFASCDRVIDQIGESIPLDDSTRSEMSRTIERFSGEALRTICLAYKDVDSGFCVDDQIPQEGYTCIGIVGIKDPVRPGVKESVALCRSAGIAVRMITGDNINTARTIAIECGILTEGGLIIEGPDFRRKSEEELLELVPKIQVMARSSPLDKLAFVKHLRTQCNEVVAVTGDGTNDAPALREADIGLSMGISGTEVAKESSDVIILDDNFSTIVTVAKWGRSVYVNIQKFVQFQLTVNAVALIVNFSSACITGHAPLTAVQLLWVNMIMDSLGALALATEPPKDELMKRPPVGRNSSFIDELMWRNIAGQTIYQLLLIWALNAEGKAIFHLSGPTADPTLNTIIFNSFVFCQIFNEISSRDMEKIDVITGLMDNYVFFGVILCTVAFQIVIVQFLGEFASTVSLDLEQWIFCVSVGFLGMPVAAAVKLIPPPRLHPRRSERK